MENQPETPEESPQTGLRRREPMFNLPWVIILLAATCCAIHVLRVFVLSDAANYEILVRYAFIPVLWSSGPNFDQTSFFSPVTYSFLHGNFAHLAVNMVWLAAFGTPLANRIGTGPFLVFWLITAIASVAFFYVFNSGLAAPLVGASGSISGVTAAATRFAFRTRRFGRVSSFSGPVLPVGIIFRNRTVVSFVLIWFFINFVAGAGAMGLGGEARIAWEAHIGGFVTGFFLISLFRERYNA